MAGKCRFRPERIVDAVDRAFEAALRPDLWLSVFQDLADAAGGTGVIALHGDMRERTAYLCSPDLVESLDYYCKHRWFERNPRLVQAAARREFNRLTTDADLPGSTSELAPDWHHEFLRPFDLGWFGGTFLYADKTSKLLISIERSYRLEPFQNAEIEVLERAMSRLRSAVMLAPTLNCAVARALATGLEDIGLAAIVLDRDGGVILMNASAGKRCGGALTVRGGRLFLAARAANDRLQTFIADLLRLRSSRDAAPDAIVFTEPDGSLVFVRGALLALSADDIFRRASIVLTLTYSDDRVQSHEPALQRLFGMTAAEAHVASQVASGVDVKTISETSRTSINTVRSQLKAAFAKTGTKRQAELAVLINKLRCNARL